MNSPYENRNRFLSIVNELRDALGYEIRKEAPDPGEELAMEMMYGNFDFAVVHSLRNAPDRILIECDFGLIPEGKKMYIIEKLLQMNTALAEIDGSIFCIDSDTEKLIYTLSQKITDTDGSKLLEKMTEIVWHGRRWMETRYLKVDQNSYENTVSLTVLA